nr:DUF1593 domain-containing protein [Saprospiraceae bacterium]
EPPVLRTDVLYQIIEAYGSIFPNLQKVDANYPSATYLRTLVKKGCAGNGLKTPVMEYIGKGKSTEGSRWIIRQVDGADGVVNIAVWGGACDVAQALFDVRDTRSAAEVQAFIAKLKVYFIGKQDSSNQWMLDNFPDVWLILGSSTDGNSWNSSYRGIFLGGNMQSTSREWLKQYVIGQHPLGSLYPDKAWTKGGTGNPHGAMKEGDTPSFFFFLNNGLNMAERPEWGGWGGRFQQSGQPYYGDAEDTVFDVSVNAKVTNAKATVFRWRPDFQADFAARVQWGRGVSEHINRYPMVKLKQDQSKGPLRLSAKPGEKLIVDGRRSTDPDGDRLSFEWMVYQEAGSFPDPERIMLSGEKSAQVSLVLPSVGSGMIHLILKVRDHATYPLTSYKRVIIEVD